ncbi:hypothetical protein BZA05DRAFT_470929 [Tricharina praecox]|uniref:uncharacterized protein n=1 Tax=Tricharina praecox TaxID=43433 RepID=UPI00221FD772|nr:uncharacterized protein BZA05DRAFT_470929 [Tricharina praecox]KAI5858109.1 hypothetical protein BZA05DRAFT_470929 [Tricharina praecox]
MDGDVASLGQFVSDMGNNESRESEHEYNGEEEEEEEEEEDVGGEREDSVRGDEDHDHVPAGLVVDELEVIHYAAAAEQLLASNAAAASEPPPPSPPPPAVSRKARGNKSMPREELQVSSPALPIVSQPPQEMSVASAVAAAAAALKARMARAEETAAVVVAASPTIPPTQMEVELPAAATEVTEKGKKRRKKKQRQTSQEEESAQALLALNKGGLGSGGVENEHAVVDDDEDAPTAVDSVTPTKKGKAKRKTRSKKATVEEVTEEDQANQSLLSLDESSSADHDLTDAFTNSMVAAAGILPSSDPPIISLNENATAATATVDQTGLPQPDIPDQRILTEHLAAHMAKLPPPPPPEAEEEDMMVVEQRLMTELQSIHPPILGAEGFTAVNQNSEGDHHHQMLGGPIPINQKPARGKRKRQGDVSNAITNDNENMPMNGLVDPQLMQLDEAAAQIAGEVGGDQSMKSKKRRRVPNPNIPEAEEIPIDESEGKQQQSVVRREQKMSWGTTPVSGMGESINGGTFSLDERFAIDKALQDYCRVQSMTMEELKDRVWGNNRRKDEFWDSICSAVPNRSRASVYKHVRRSCHIFQQRAKWTAEEDAELAELVKSKGNKWKDIGEAMGRMGEDCRDRYRNYVKCGDSRGTDRWTEEEEELLKRTVREHKEQNRQLILQQGKPNPAPEEEDNILINWTTVSEQMENRRSRIQCRYKWKKMLAQKEKVKQAPIGVTYVGGKKKRISFDIKDMLPGDEQWLLFLIRDCGATQENEIPWDQFAKNDKDVGIWTHKDLKSAYKEFRKHIPHKRRPLREIIKQLLIEIQEKYTVEQRSIRFIPSQNADGQPIDAASIASHNTISTHSPAAPHAQQPQQQQQQQHPPPQEFVHHLYTLTPDPSLPIAPIASMGPIPMAAQLSVQPPAPTPSHNNAVNAAAAAASNAMVDPELMGQGMDEELQKMAGEAIAHSTAMHAHAHSQQGEDENERELRTRLGGFIGGIGGGGAAGMMHQGAA